MRHIPQSPYLRALGEDRSRLHPGLATYFSAVPRGAVGVGTGVLRRVGTPRRWLWPVLRMLQGRGAVLAGWYADVPFTVRNRTIAGRALAERTFHLPEGDWIMRDAVTVLPHGMLVDRLGEPPVLAAAFDADVDAGSLRLRSTALGIRLGGLRIRLPKPVAPVIRLCESIDESTGRQRVELTVDAPLLGRIYEYDGTFTYRLHESTDDGKVS